MAAKRKKKKDSWFFTKSLLDEINDLSDEVLEERVASLKENQNEEKQEKTNDPSIQASEPFKQEEQKVFPLKFKQESTLQQLTEENKELKAQKDKLEQVKQELLKNQTEVTEVTKKLMKQKEQLIKEKKQLQEKLTAQQLSNADDQQQKTKQDLAKVQHLQQEIQSLRGHLDKSMNEKASLSEKNTQLLQQIAMEKQNQQATVDLISQPKEEQQKLIEEKDALSEALYRSHGEIIHLQSQLEEEQARSQKVPLLEQKLMDQQAIYQSLKQKFTSATQEIARLQQSQADYAQLQHQIKQTQEKVGILSKELANKQQDIQEVTQQLIAKEEKIEGLTQHSQVLEGQVSEAQTAYHAEKDHAQSMEDQFYKLQEETAAKQAEVSKILLSAKKQGDEVIQEAHQEAHQLIETAKQRALSMENQAKQLSRELACSKQKMSELYKQMEENIGQFSRNITEEQTSPVKEGESNVSSLTSN